MIQVHSSCFSNTELCDKIFEIRRRVFVDEQKVSREEEFDEHEDSSIHYLGTNSGRPAGTARWRITDTGIKLERFAVLPEYRNKGVAAMILREVLNHVVPLDKKIYLHAQVTAVAFYEKYGFKKEGPMFTEANIDHFKMTYQ